MLSDALPGTVAAEVAPDGGFRFPKRRGGAPPSSAPRWQEEKGPAAADPAFWSSVVAGATPNAGGLKVGGLVHGELATLLWVQPSPNTVLYSRYCTSK